MSDIHTTTIYRRWFLAMLLLTAFFLPFKLRIAGASLISTSVLLSIIPWWLEGNLHQKLQRLRKRAGWLALLTGFFLLHLLGLLYTDNMQAGWFNVEKKIALLILPLLLATAEPLRAQELQKIKQSFVRSCLLASLLCLGYALLRMGHDEGLWTINLVETLHPNPPEQSLPLPWNYISYAELGAFVEMHPTYFALYLLFCLFILLDEGQRRQVWDRAGQGGRKLALLLLLLYLSLFLLLLGARIVIAAYMLAMVGCIVFYFYRRRQPARALMPVTAFLLLCLLLLYSLPLTRSRLVQEVSNTRLELPQQAGQWNSTNLRLLQWQSSLEHIRSHWLLGVGTGDTQDKLLESYQKVDLGSLKGNYNAHNQYLQSTLALGLVGGLLLLACFLLPLRLALRQKQYLYAGFIALFGLCCLTESMLETQKGVVFYAFFNTVFLFYLLNEKDRANNC